MTVRNTCTGPTGYEATFSLFNASAINVTIAGGFQTFTDEFHTNAYASAAYDPHDYKPGWFRSLGIYPSPRFAMVNDGTGNWTYTTPLPSGTY